ncbi:MAG: branched-chain amino acid ABC transporter permease [Alphaproteobacteria bacterium]
MSLTEYGFQQLINALSIGSLYALMAIGLAMVFGILRLINFAHGDLMMVGSYAALGLLLAGLPYWTVVPIVVVVTALAGMLMERVAYRPIRGAPDVAMLLTSFAVTIILENSAVMLIGARSRPFPVPEFLRTVFHFGNLTVSSVNVVAIVVTAILLVLLTLFVTRTDTGISMRAAADNMVAAHLMGIRINRVIAAAFAIGSGLAAIAGLLWTAKVGKVDPYMGFFPVLKAFVAAVIGGFGTIPGAVLGGFVLGFLEISLQAVLPGQWSAYRDALVFGVLIVVLLVRPSGILGARVREEI